MKQATEQLQKAKWRRPIWRRVNAPNSILRKATPLWAVTTEKTIHKTWLCTQLQTFNAVGHFNRIQGSRLRKRNCEDKPTDFITVCFLATEVQPAGESLHGTHRITTMIPYMWTPAGRRNTHLLLLVYAKCRTDRPLKALDLLAHDQTSDSERWSLTQQQSVSDIHRAGFCASSSPVWIFDEALTPRWIRTKLEDW